LSGGGAAGERLRVGDEARHLAQQRVRLAAVPVQREIGGPRGFTDDENGERPAGTPGPCGTFACIFSERHGRNGAGSEIRAGVLGKRAEIVEGHQDVQQDAVLAKHRRDALREGKSSDRDDGQQDGGSLGPEPKLLPQGSVRNRAGPQQHGRQPAKQEDIPDQLECDEIGCFGRVGQENVADHFDVDDDAVLVDEIGGGGADQQEQANHRLEDAGHREQAEEEHQAADRHDEQGRDEQQLIGISGRDGCKQLPPEREIEHGDEEDGCAKEGGLRAYAYNHGKSATTARKLVFRFRTSPHIAARVQGHFRTPASLTHVCCRDREVRCSASRNSGEFATITPKCAVLDGSRRLLTKKVNFRPRSCLAARRTAVLGRIERPGRAGWIGLSGRSADRRQAPLASF
jgi:hypothetical protein